METAPVELNSLESIAKSEKKISYEEFLELCDEDTLAEWVDGEIAMIPPTTFKHHSQLNLTNNHIGDVFYD